MKFFKHAKEALTILLVIFAINAVVVGITELIGYFFGQAGKGIFAAGLLIALLCVIRK